MTSAPDARPGSLDPALVEHFVEHFDHHDARLGADPFAVSTAMRERCPVAHSDVHDGFWVVSNYDDARAIMQDPKVFTSAKGARIPAGGKHRPLPPLETDPPDHAKFRGLIAKAFSPRNINALEPKIRKLCDMLIGQFHAKGECDLIADLAAPLPTTIFVEMMGLPLEDAEKFHTWATLINHQAHAGDTAMSAGEAQRQTLEYLAGLIEARKADPQDDIMSALLDAVVDDEPIDPEDMLYMTFLLFLGGLDTVTSAMSFMFQHLAERPDLRQQILDDPTVIPKAVEEFLRYEPVIMIGRGVTEDVELSGCPVKADDRVLINSIAANRDPAQFENPEDIDFSRDANRHLTFGVGPHRCVGSHLARLELKIVLEEFHARIPHYEIKPGATPTRHMNQVNGLDSLPLTWTV